MMKRNLLIHTFVALAFLFAVQASAQTTKWRDIHKVKKSETIFGIAKTYGVTIPELLNANPEMKKDGYELKAGDWVFVPYAKEGDVKAGRRKWLLPRPQNPSRQLLTRQQQFLSPNL